MNQKQESVRFLELAFADRDAALALSSVKEIKSHINCFHAQQAVENNDYGKLS